MGAVKSGTLHHAHVRRFLQVAESFCPILEGMRKKQRLAGRDLVSKDGTSGTWGTLGNPGVEELLSHSVEKPFTEDGERISRLCAPFHAPIIKVCGWLPTCQHESTLVGSTLILWWRHCSAYLGLATRDRGTHVVTHLGGRHSIY